MSAADQIISAMQQQGPILPADAAKAIRTSILIASAHLSELASRSKLRISNIKVGGSPLYYLPGHEAKLQDFIENLDQKEVRAVQLLRERKVIRDTAADPLTRVALRSVKDFAVPLNVTLGNQQETFWKWYLISDEEATAVIRGLLEPAPPPPPQALAQQRQELPIRPGAEPLQAPAQQRPEPPQKLFSQRPQPPLPQQPALLKSSPMRPASAGVGGTPARLQLDSSPKDNQVERLGLVRAQEDAARSPRLGLVRAQEDAARSPRLGLVRAQEKRTFPHGERELFNKAQQPRQPLQEQQKLEQPKQRAKPRQKPARPGSFSAGIGQFFGQKGITVRSEQMIRRDSEMLYTIEVPSAVGPLPYLCKACSKKRVTEKDLSAALVEGQLGKLPVMLLHNGTLTPKAQELAKADAFKTMVIVSLSHGN